MQSARPDTSPTTSLTLPDEVAVTDAVVEEVDPDTVVARAAEEADAQQASLEHVPITTSDSLGMMMAELPRCMEIKTTATPMTGTINPTTTAPTAAIRTSFTTTQQLPRAPIMVVTCTNASCTKPEGVGSMMNRTIPFDVPAAAAHVAVF